MRYSLTSHMHAHTNTHSHARTHTHTHSDACTHTAFLSLNPTISFFLSLCLSLTLSLFHYSIIQFLKLSFFILSSLSHLNLFLAFSTLYFSPHFPSLSLSHSRSLCLNIFLSLSFPPLSISPLTLSVCHTHTHTHPHTHLCTHPRSLSRSISASVSS